MPGGRFGCSDSKSDTTTAAAGAAPCGPVHRGYQPGDTSHFLASSYGGPSSSSVGYRSPNVHHSSHYGDPQSGLMSYFSEAAAAGLQSSFMGCEALSKQGIATDYSTSSHGESKGGQPSPPSSFSLQQQQLQQQHIHQLHMIQQQRLHQQQSQLQRQQLLSNLNLSSLHQGDPSQVRPSSSNQYCKPSTESEDRTESPDVSRNLVGNFTDPAYHPRKKYIPYDESNKQNMYNPQALLENDLMQRIGQSVMSCAMKDMAECASSSKTLEYSTNPMKVEDLTRNIPVSSLSPSDESKPCVLGGYRDQNLTPTREDSMGHDLPLETTLHEGEEYHSNMAEDKRDHHNAMMTPSLDDDSINQGGRAKIYECSLCQFTCRKQTDLVNHVTVHPDEKPFHCNQCDYKGAKYHYLRNHLLTHSQRPLLSCTECNYKCYQNGALKVHMRRHSDEKRYACTTCHYRTHFKGNLKLHLRVHTGEKPYACNVCDFRCTQSGSLKIHMRGHSGEKPYGCDLCEYRSKHKGNLVMHRRKHTGDKPYHCDQCDYKAAQRMGLTKHGKTVHGLVPSPRPANQPPDTPSDLSVILHRKAEESFLVPMANDSSNSPAPSDKEGLLPPKLELLEQSALPPAQPSSQPYSYYEQNLKERKPLMHHFEDTWKLNNVKESQREVEEEQQFKVDDHDPLYTSDNLQNSHFRDLPIDNDNSER